MMQIRLLEESLGRNQKTRADECHTRVFHEDASAVITQP